MSSGILSWDWKGQPDLDRLAQLVYEVSGGTVYLYAPGGTDDDYVLVVSSEPLEPDAVWSRYQRHLHGGDDA